MENNANNEHTKWFQSIFHGFSTSITKLQEDNMHLQMFYLLMDKQMKSMIASTLYVCALSVTMIEIWL